MSRVQDIIRILDAFVGHSGKVNKDQTIGNEFDTICHALFGVENSFEFVSDFAGLLEQVEEDIARVPNLSERQRQVYMKQLVPLRKLFSSKTYTWTWKTFFERIWDGDIRNSLLLMDPLLDPDRYNLKKEIDREAIKA